MSISLDNELMTVKSKGAVFQLTISDGTVIDYLPERNVGLEGLPTDAGFRIAGLVSSEVTNDDGNVTPEILTAQKITAIPEKATRGHKWAIAVDKQGDGLTTLDEDGSRTDLPGRGSGFEMGDNLIVLVQNSGQEGSGDKVRGLLNARIVADRLDRLIQAEADDPLRTAALADLLDRHEKAEELRLQRTAENAGTDFQDFVLSSVRAFQESMAAKRTFAAMAQTEPECAQSVRCPAVAGTVVDESPVIQITSPPSGTVVSANYVVAVMAEARVDAGVASATFNVAGSDLKPLTEEPYMVDVTVPTGGSSVEIKVTAVDAEGNEVSDSITLLVARATDVGSRSPAPLPAPSPLAQREKAAALPLYPAATRP